MIKFYLKILLFFGFLCKTNITYSQNSSIILKELITQSFDRNTTKIDNKESQAVVTLYNIYYSKGSNHEKDSIAIIPFKGKKTSERNHIEQLAVAYYNLYYQRRSEDTFISINESYKRTKNIEQKSAHKLSLIAFLELYARENTLNSTSFNFYLDAYRSIATTTIDEGWILFYNTLYIGRSVKATMEEYENLCLQSISFLKKNEGILSISQKAAFFENISNYYRVINKNEEAKTYALRTIGFPDKPYLRIHKYNSFLDLAQIAISEKDIEKGNHFMNSAYKLLDNGDYERSLSSYYQFKSHYYHRPLKEFEKAYDFQNKAVNLNNKIKYDNNSLRISELNVELRTAEKEKQILEERNQKKRSQNIVVILGTSLFLLSIIAILIYRNTKRKQRIAEQEKALQVQKTTAILKEQEINTINAMIEGQEKERLNIARDLHDSLGGTLAAVKMHLGNMQNNLTSLNNSKELLDKANDLISDAYTNVRSIAHERNSGVIAKDGLLPAVERLANKVSSPNNIKISVEAFKLEERLSNHIEITIFRIIQELVTNIIKHAKATEANISLTQHDNELNIIIEDNGIGFNTFHINKKEGMGLISIERRVEHLEGSMLVDSTPQKGTNIIIDIPI